MYCNVSVGDTLNVWDQIGLQQSQGLLFHDPTLKTRTVLCHKRVWFCTLVPSIVSYSCIHSSDLWDWIGSQGLLFHDPTSSLVLQLLQDNWIPVRSWSCPCNSRCWCHFESYFKLLSFWETVLKLWEFKTQWLLALDSAHFHWMQCNAFQSLHLGRNIKLIRRWKELQFAGSAQARSKSEVIARCAKYK